MGSPSRNVQYHPPRLSEDRLNLAQPHSPSLPTHCSGKSGMRPLLNVPERAVPGRQHRAVREVQVRPDPGPFRRTVDDWDWCVLHQRRQASFLGRLAHVRALQRELGFPQVADGFGPPRVCSAALLGSALA